MASSTEESSSEQKGTVKKVPKSKAETKKRKKKEEEDNGDTADHVPLGLEDDEDPDDGDLDGLDGLQKLLDIPRKKPAGRTCKKPSRHTGSSTTNKNKVWRDVSGFNISQLLNQSFAMFMFDHYFHAVTV